jgi:hypothetical protein
MLSGEPLSIGAALSQGPLRREISDEAASVAGDGGAPSGGGG